MRNDAYIRWLGIMKHGLIVINCVPLPSTLQEDADDLASLRLGQVTEPVDTIFVKSVRHDGPAARAGLCVGKEVGIAILAYFAKIFFISQI